MNIELDRVLIQGKGHAVHYGMLTLAEILEAQDLSLGEAFERLQKLGDPMKLKAGDIQFVYDLMLAGFRMGAKVTNEDFPYNRAQLDVFMPLGSEGFHQVLEIFQKAFPADDSNNESQKKVKTKPTKK